MKRFGQSFIKFFWFKKEAPEDFFEERWKHNLFWWFKFVLFFFDFRLIDLFINNDKRSDFPFMEIDGDIFLDIFW